MMLINPKKNKFHAESSGRDVQLYRETRKYWSDMTDIPISREDAPPAPASIDPENVD